MPIPCGFHGFYMEYFWLRAQPFWCKFPCSFHMETPGNCNIPWNISLESRWNPPQFIPCNPWIPYYSTWIPHFSTIFYMDSTLFHIDSPFFHIIPYRFHIVPHGFHIFHIIPYGFHMDSTFFHIDSTHFHIETQAIIEYSSWGHQPNLVFCSVHWVRSHDFPKQVKIFKSMTFKIITHYVYIYYISKKSINCIESENKLQGLFYSLFWYKKSKNQVNFTKVTKNNE